MASVTELGQKVKAKYPGQYDDLSDAEVGQKTKARFPGQYDDFTDEPAAASHPPTGRESVIGEEAPGFGRGVARGGWALPGLVGLDYETAAGAEFAIRDPMNLEKSQGLGFMDRLRWYRERERERSRRGETENPVKTGLGVGVGSAPSSLVMPQAKAAEGAGLAGRAAASALTAGAQSAAIEGGVSADLPVGERLGRMGTAAVAGGALGTLAPMPSHVPTQPQADAAAGRSVPEPVADWLAGKAEKAAIRSTGTDRTALRSATNGSEGKTRAIGRLLLDDDVRLRSPETILEDVGGIQSREGPKVAALADRADTAGARVGLASAIERIKAEVIDPLAGSAQPEKQAMAQNIEARLAEWAKRADAQGTVSPSEAHALRMDIDDVVKWNKQDGKVSVNDSLQQMRRILSDELGTAIEGAGLGDEWAATNATFAAASGAKKLAKTGVQRNTGNSILSPTEKGGSILGAGMALAGEPLSGAALAAGTVAARRYGAPVAARTLDKLSKALRTNPQAFGEHSTKLLAAAERGPEALAAAHYVLSLDPGSGYRARAAQVLDTPDDRLASEETP